MCMVHLSYPLSKMLRPIFVSTSEQCSEYCQAVSKGNDLGNKTHLVRS